MTTITYSAHAYSGPHGSLDAILAGRESPCIMNGKWKDGEISGYVYLGPVTVTTECRPADEVVAGQIATLQSMLQTVRAANQKKENAILDQISKLTSIAYEA